MLVDDDGGCGCGDDRLGVSVVLMGRSDGEEDRIGSERAAGEVDRRGDRDGGGRGRGRGLQEGLVDGDDALCVLLVIYIPLNGCDKCWRGLLCVR